MSDASEAAVKRREALRDDRRVQYERLLEIRTFEDRIQELFAEGLVHGTTHTCQGQEAVSIGVARAARLDDVVTCTYRGHGHALALGMTPEVVLGEIMGRTVGCLGGLGGSMHLCEPEVGLLPTFAIVGAGIPVAAGAALTAQVQGTDNVAIGIFGDGATNIGAFHEGLNLAAVWQLPAVFICENNLYGEYSPLETTTPVEDLALRAASYDMPSESVDGMDPDVVAEAVQGALDRARDGAGPTFLEMKTYRFAGHSRSDTAPYRPEGELERWQRRDPLTLFRDRLVEEGVISESDAEDMRETALASLEETIEHVMASPEPQPSDMFNNIYAG